MQNLNSGVQPSTKGRLIGLKQVITDGFSIKINPEVLHEYAERNGMMQCAYSLVRACYLRDLRAGHIH